MFNKELLIRILIIPYIIVYTLVYNYTDRAARIWALKCEYGNNISDRQTDQRSE